MGRMLIAAVLTLAALPARAAEDDIVLRGMGSFHVGGRVAEVSGRPAREIVRIPGGPPSKLDPNGEFMVEQMYVQYFLPKHRKGKLPLLMWHGGGLTGVTYETTPDGREGWLNWFVKKGWDVYNSDAVERGRSGFAMVPEIFKTEPLFLPKSDPYERFRIGNGPGSYSNKTTNPGVQFPVEGYDNFMRQVVPRWTSTDEAILAAYTALVDKLCPCVILFHSQAGQFGFKVAQARPEKVKALIAVEPAGTGDPKQAERLKGVPTLFVYGDFIEKDARWPQIRKNGIAFGEAVTAAGGNVQVVNLPQAGIRGNSHMLMMDKNNQEVAALIQQWLEKQGLYR